MSADIWTQAIEWMQPSPRVAELMALLTAEDGAAPLDAAVRHEVAATLKQLSYDYGLQRMMAAGNLQAFRETSSELADLVLEGPQRGDAESRWLYKQMR